MQEIHYCFATENHGLKRTLTKILMYQWAADGPEICELMGTYLLSQINDVISKKIYRIVQRRWTRNI